MMNTDANNDTSQEWKKKKGFLPAIVAAVALVSMAGVSKYVSQPSSLRISSLPIASIEVSKNNDSLFTTSENSSESRKGKASTTTFPIGSTTACGCTAPQINGVLSQRFKDTGEKWVGVATPAWMMGEYLLYARGRDGERNEQCNCSGKECLFNPTYNNCGSGAHGGCGSCWQLTVDGDPNTVIYGIVVDNCGLGDNGGNNEWCVPYTNIDNDGVCPSSNFQEGGAEKCPTSQNPVVTNCNGKLAAPGDWKSSANPYREGHDAYTWSHTDCGSGNPGIDGDFDNFKCTNAAGYKMHFDMAVVNDIPGIYNPTQPALPWQSDWGSGKTYDNPVVIPELITCPASLMQKVANSCKGMPDYQGNPGYTYCDSHVWTK